MSATLVIGAVFNALFTGMYCLLYAMLLTYVALIRGRLTKLFGENLHLLDKMNEGLILVSETDSTL